MGKLDNPLNVVKCSSRETFFYFCHASVTFGKMSTICTIQNKKEFPPISRFQHATAVSRQQFKKFTSPDALPH